MIEVEERRFTDGSVETIIRDDGEMVATMRVSRRVRSLVTPPEARYDVEIHLRRSEHESPDDDAKCAQVLSERATAPLRVAAVA